MLITEHIACLRLERYKLEAHAGMAPGCICKETTRRLAAVGNAVIGELLNVPPAEFEQQLEAARSMGAAYLHERAKNRLAGVSAYVSVVKDNDILDKNLILPRAVMNKHVGLENHYILGVYLVGTGKDLRITDQTDIILAGWTDVDGIRRDKANTVPFNFKSKVPVVIVPCSRLYPISEFIPRLQQATVVL
jgi:hypothetical protein